MNYDITKFELDKYLYPIWSGNVSYAEPAFVRENESGELAPISLLYPIEKIISVRSADLKTEYKFGTDYTVENGKLVILKSGDIPFLKYEEYFFPLTVEEHEKNKLETKLPAANKSGWGYIRAEIGKDKMGMAVWTLAVTYTHSDKCAVTPPLSKNDVFKTLCEKAKNGNVVRIVSTGDSITDGWSSSAKVGNPPYCPQYNLLVEEYIKKAFGATVNQINVGVSGSDSNGGLSKLDEIVSYSPDLVVIAFGMNDGCAVLPEKYADNINKMVARIERECPDASVAVIGTCFPNEEMSWSVGGGSILVYHKEYIKVLEKAEKTWKNAAFVDIGTVNLQLLKRKTYQDLAGSNSNHPNDYMHRIYAQVMLRTIFGNDFCE